MTHYTVSEGAILDREWSMFDQQPDERQESVAAFSAHPVVGKTACSTGRPFVIRHWQG
jgi:hypothetical protein